jgi:hypothetical protein
MTHAELTALVSTLEPTHPCANCAAPLSRHGRMGHSCIAGFPGKVFSPAQAPVVQP